VKIMKLLLATAMLAVALPAFGESAAAQTGPTTTNGIPDTALSTASTPSTGPRAQEANLPSNSAASANNSALATDPTRVTAAPAMVSYPICKAGQFDDCMEPGNGPRPATKKRTRRYRR